jgi:hypothetical protein
MTEKSKEELIKQLGIDIKNRVFNEKLVLTDVYKEFAEGLDYEDRLYLALAVSSERRLDRES